MKPASLHIQKFDDFLPPEDFAQSVLFAKSIRWGFGWVSNNLKAAPDQSKYWHVDFDGRVPSNNTKSVIDKVTDPFIQKMWQRLTEGPCRGHTLIRCYANAHTYGVPGSPHTDRREDGYWSFVYYANDRWDPAWAGETVFYDRTGDLCHASLPRPNRLVAFPSNIVHAARPVEQHCTFLRMCYVFKTKAPV
jgi:SM-20-related protein